jgi:hypothetical protein
VEVEVHLVLALRMPKQATCVFVLLLHPCSNDFVPQVCVRTLLSIERAHCFEKSRLKVPEHLFQPEKIVRMWTTTMSNAIAQIEKLGDPTTPDPSCQKTSIEEIPLLVDDVNKDRRVQVGQPILSIRRCHVLMATVTITADLDGYG